MNTYWIVTNALGLSVGIFHTKDAALAVLRVVGRGARLERVSDGNITRERVN